MMITLYISLSSVYLGYKLGLWDAGRMLRNEIKKISLSFESVFGEVDVKEHEANKIWAELRKQK